MKQPKENRLLEDQVIDKLIKWLKKDKWKIESFCKGNKRGIDILAIKENNKLITEAKGARGNPDHPSTKKEKFSSGQVNTHLGVAIVKVLRERGKSPGSKVAIAHPDDQYLRDIISPIVPTLKKANIRFLWVKENGEVIEE